MAQGTYQIVFSGELQPGAELAMVKRNVARLFKADENNVAALFSGKRIVVKRDIDEQTARQYQAAFHKAGALCHVVDSAAAPAKQPAAQPAAVPADTSAPPASETPAAAGAIDLAPVGADVADAVAQEVPPPPDVSHLSMAAAGSEVADPPTR